MKVYELFEAAQGEPGQKGTLSGGAYYKPKYDDDAKVLRGSTIDWMKELRITPEDIQQAISKFKQTRTFKQTVPGAKLKYDPSPIREKKGTLNFSFKYIADNGRECDGAYQIHANGQIRGSAPRNWADNGEATYRIVSPKPRMIVGDNVQSLVNIYSAAAEKMADTFKKRIEKNNRAVAKKQAEKEKADKK